MILHVYCDGGARGNPGPAAVGVVIKDEEDKLLWRLGKKIGEATNNIAEYTAVIEALAHIQKQAKPTRTTLYLDSELVVCQLTGLFKVKNAKLRELLVQVRTLEGEVGGNISYKHIPREENYEADKLVNNALDA